ncbi:hypothetical protein R1sor_016066 [Riccia sorocarpa]|uniref:Uncharacterized protein n=1 Tax=Riccia sorocarpa TaxID=122646 RepID=A0ABD3HH51_9MARC
MTTTVSRVNHGPRPVPVPPSDFGGGISPGRREKMLRWNSRNSLAEEKVVPVVDSSSQQERRRSLSASASAANPSRASPTLTSYSTSLQQHQGRAAVKPLLVYMASPLGLQSPPARLASPSPSRKGESVRRRRSRVSVDFDSDPVDISSSINSKSRLQHEQPSTSKPTRSVPTFEEILNQRMSASKSTTEAAPSNTSQRILKGDPEGAVNNGITNAVDDSLISTNSARFDPGQDHGDRQLRSSLTRVPAAVNKGPDDFATFQHSKERKQVTEYRSPLVGTGSIVDASTSQEKRVEPSADHKDSEVDPMQKRRSSKVADVAAAERSHNPSASTDDLKTRQVRRLIAVKSPPVGSSSGITTETVRRTLGRLASDGNSSRPQLQEFRTVTGKDQGSSTKHFDHGASNSALENRRSDGAGAARASVNGTRRLKLQQKIDYSSGCRPQGYESLSSVQSASPSTWQCIPDPPPGNSSPRITSRRQAAVKSKIPESLRKALDFSRVRFRVLPISCGGLPISCGGLSIAENSNGLDNSRSKLGSFGCGPPPSSPGRPAAKSQTDQQRKPRAQSPSLQQLFVNTTTQSTSKPSNSASPVKSLRKWMTDQFQLGGGKKTKDGVIPTTTSNSLQSDQNVQQQPDSIGNHLYRIAARNRNSNPEIKPPDQREFELEPPKSQNVSKALETMVEQFVFDEDLEVQPRRRHHPHERSLHPSAKSAHLMITHSGPLKFEGLQHLFGAESYNPSSQGRQNGSQTDSDGETQRAIKFLERSEVAKLNAFLRAKRDSVASCQRSGSGSLKFISTSHPIDLGSIICAICYSYYLEKRSQGPGRWNVVPLMNFSRWRMVQNLDAAWLFDACGLDGEALLFANEVDIEGLSRGGITTRTLFVGDQILRKSDEIGSCCTLLAETFIRDADELWARSGSIIKTLLLAGLLMDTENLRKGTSSATSTREHRILLHLLTGSACLDRLVLYERSKHPITMNMLSTFQLLISYDGRLNRISPSPDQLLSSVLLWDYDDEVKAAYRDARVLSRVGKYYGTALEGQSRDGSMSPFPLHPPGSRRLTNSRSGTKNLLSRGSSLLSSSEADSYSRSFGSPTSLSSSWVRSLSSSSPDIVDPHPGKPAVRSLSALGRLPSGTLTGI